MTDTLWTVAQIADALRVDSEIVLAHIRAGRLRAVNVASPGSTRPRWRVAPDDLDAFLAARRNAPPPTGRTRRRAESTDIIKFF